MLQRDSGGHDAGAQRGRGLLLIPDGAALRGMLCAESRRQHSRVVAVILRHQGSRLILGYLYAGGALRVYADSRPACRSSASRRIAGSSLPRLEALRRIPRQAF